MSSRKTVTFQKWTQVVTESKVTNGMALSNDVTLEQLTRRQETVLSKLDALRIEIDRLLERRTVPTSSSAILRQHCTSVLTSSTLPPPAARLQVLDNFFNLYNKLAVMWLNVNRLGEAVVLVLSFWFYDRSLHKGFALVIENARC